MKLWIIIAITSFLNQSWADPQDSQYKSAYQKGVEEQEREAQRQQAVNEQHATSKSLGFHENRSGEAAKDVIAGVIADAISAPYYESVLVLRVSCEVPNSIVLLYPRFKDMSWELEKDKAGEPKLKYTSKGTSQSDAEGFYRLRFSTKGSISQKRITLKFGEAEHTLKLAEGPYELSLPEPFCKNKK
jgi:hypothetical protein